MSARLSKEDRLQRLIEKTRRRVDEKPEATRLLSHSPNSLLGVLVREGGYERVRPSSSRSSMTASKPRGSPAFQN